MVRRGGGGFGGGGGFRSSGSGGSSKPFSSSRSSSSASSKSGWLPWSSSREDDKKQSYKSKSVPSAPSSAPVQSRPASLKPVSSAPPPAPVQRQSVAGGLGSSFADGMAFGGGNAIGHRAADAVLGPRVVRHEATTAGARTVNPEACSAQMKAFQECLTVFESDLSKCHFYIDMLCECRGCSKTGLSA